MSVRNISNILASQAKDSAALVSISLFLFFPVFNYLLSELRLFRPPAHALVQHAAFLLILLSVLSFCLLFLKVSDCIIIAAVVHFEIVWLRNVVI
jgi:hypothetical protein